MHPHISDCELFYTLVKYLFLFLFSFLMLVQVLIYSLEYLNKLLSKLGGYCAPTASRPHHYIIAPGVSVHHLICMFQSCIQHCVLKNMHLFNVFYRVHTGVL